MILIMIRISDTWLPKFKLLWNNSKLLLAKLTQTHTGCSEQLAPDLLHLENPKQRTSPRTLSSARKRMWTSWAKSY